MIRPLSREEYTVGWVCALPIELAAAKAMLDEEHGVVSSDDNNLYCMGSMAGHNVVIVCLPAGRIGNNPAAAVATQMQAAFKGLRFGLMVGIGGGVPSAKADIRLGDVVVSHPKSTFGGVVQYDMGKSIPRGFRRTGSLNAPPQILLSAVNAVRANETLNKSTMPDHLSNIQRIPAFRHPKAVSDVLFDASYSHQPGPTCDKCNVNRQESRSRRESGEEVTIHYGTIASGNQVIKNATKRNKISNALDGVLCFEMEAAGLMDTYPCLVIRGICDYADSHKNKQWQSYAAGTAAAYAKELLRTIPAAEVIESRRAQEAMRSGNKRRFEPASPVRASSKRSKHDGSVCIEEGIEGTDCTLADRTPPGDSTKRNMQRTVTLPFHQQQRSQPPINDEQKQTMIESLKFDQIDARQMTIKPAHAKTCKWLLNSPQYIDWLDASKIDEHHGFLWIKGKAGAGKSTLMKFATVDARKTMKECTVLTFFFNARGEEIEKSTIGTYRSLLVQLLKAFPELHIIISSTGISASTMSVGQQWSVESLKALLEQAIQSLGQSSVVCFIDALDECEEDQVREMIRFLERISGIAVSNGLRFKVCFSSRHYPHVTITKGLELVLEGYEGHTQDIANYIETELKIGKSKAAQRIRGELQEKASGVFMWVVLVVEILNKEFDRGQVHALRKRLQEIPGDLHELFCEILTRDSHNKELLVLCIQWVLFARKPLSPDQLYHALLSSVDPDEMSDWDAEDVTKDDMKRYILNSSKGLTEATAVKESRIQFIHESVRDFLLKENGLSKICPEFVENFHGKSHERLRQCCLDYVEATSATTSQISSNLPTASSLAAAELRTSTAQSFPFLEYAVRNLLYHADTAEGEGVSQADFLNSFAIAQWVKLNNLFEKREVRRYTTGVSQTYLLAELDMVNLIKASDLAGHCMDIEAERYGCPLFAAAALSNEKVLELFTRSIIGGQVDESSPHTTDTHRPQQIAAQCAGRREFHYSKRKGFLACVGELGLDEIMLVLISSRMFDINAKGSLDRTPLWWTTKNGCEMGVKSLLSEGSTMINSKDQNSKTPLFIAAEEGFTAIVETLINGGADINLEAGHHGSALYVASEKGHQDVTALLLDKGADMDMICQPYYGTPLTVAIAEGHKAIVELLLNNGANVNAQSEWSSNALQAASQHGNRKIVELLLDRGSEINAQGGYYGNALQAASVNGHKELVKLLLDEGADVHAQGGPYGNALQGASYRGYQEIVVLLLNNGANINAHGGKYGSALKAALNGGCKEVVKLLKKRGAIEEAGSKRTT